MPSVVNTFLSPQPFARSGFRETATSSARISSSVLELPTSQRHNIRPIAPIPYIRSDNQASSPQPVSTSPLPSTRSNPVSYQPSPATFPATPLPVTPPLVPVQAHNNHPDPTRLLPPSQHLRISTRDNQRTPRCQPLSISPSHSKESDRWSNVVPPESALFFAVVWDDKDEMVAFSPADIARYSVVRDDDHRTDVDHELEEVVEGFGQDDMDIAFYALESEMEDHWEGVEVDVESTSEYEDSDGSATITPLQARPGAEVNEQLTPTTSHYPSLHSSVYFQIIRDHGNIMQSHPPPINRNKTSRFRSAHHKHTGHGQAMGVASSSSPSLSSSIPFSSSSVHGMTRTSSTLGGLDVYLKGLPLKKTHRNQPFYSVLEFELDADLDARLRIDSTNFGETKHCRSTGSARESKFSLPWTTIEPPTPEEIAMLLKERENAREKAGKRLKKKSRWALVSPQPAERPCIPPQSHNPSAHGPFPPLSPQKRINKPTSIPLTAYLRPSPRFPCKVPTSSPPHSPPPRLTPPNSKPNGALSRGIPSRLAGFPSLSRTSSSTLRTRSTTPNNTHSNLSRAPSHVHARPTNPQAIYFERQSQYLADSPVVGSGLGMGFCQPLFSNVFRLVGIRESGCKLSERMGEWVMVDSGSLTGRLGKM